MDLLPDSIRNSNILISPLDWGFGHLTRCIPIIHKLILNDNKVVFAGTKNQIDFIGREFPQIETELIKGYEITLDATKSTYLQLVKQSKKFLSIIDKENKLANDLVLKHKIDIVVSDNRYGFLSEKVKNVFITHQLNLQIPFFQKLTNKKLNNYISRFDVCWVPDDEKNPICGDLALNNFNIKIHHIGLLSRFKKLDAEIIYDFIYISSGPEPEKTRFTKVIYDLLKKSNKKFAIIGNNTSLQFPELIYNPNTEELNRLIASSNVVLSRAGYTSIMELLSMDKKAVLIPTKGQYEQEYLSKTISHPNFLFVTENDMASYLLDK